MLTAMACCPLPTGRVGHGSAPWRVTDASEGPLLRCCEGAWGSQTRGATYPVACATILLVCLCAAHSVVPDPLTPAAAAALCRRAQAACRWLGAHHGGQHQAFERAERSKAAEIRCSCNAPFLSLTGSLSGGHFPAELLLLLFAATLR